MNDRVVDALRDLYRVASIRFGVERLTALMCTALYESVFPNASEAGKLSIVRMIQACDQRGISESDFLRGGMNLKAHMWISDDEVIWACNTEKQRQEAAPREHDSEHIRNRPTLEAELQIRENRIRELEAAHWTPPPRGQVHVEDDSSAARAVERELWNTRRRELLGAHSAYRSNPGGGDQGFSPAPSMPNEATIRRLVARKWNQAQYAPSPTHSAMPLRPTSAVTTRSSVGDHLRATPNRVPSTLVASPSPMARSSRFGSISRVLALEKQATASAFGF
jgi:hypothetical protein